MESFFSIETLTDMTASQWLIILLIYSFFLVVLLLFYLHRRNNLKRMGILKEQLELQIHSQALQQDEKMQRFKDGLHNHLNEISTHLNAADNKVSALANLFYEYANEPDDMNDVKKEAAEISPKEQQQEPGT
jgi:hypothetical protein